jgi:hypothetical protein
MKRNCVTLGCALAVAVAAAVSLSGSAEAACGPGYKPVKHKSGNTVCVLDVVAGGGKLKLKTR